MVNFYKTYINLIFYSYNVTNYYFLNTFNPFNTNTTNDINYIRNKRIHPMNVTFKFEERHIKNINYIIVNKFEENIENIESFSEKIIDFIKEKYNIDNNISNKLFFDENKKYIFYNELEEKNGKKYNEIIKNNIDINEYSTHAASFTDLYTVLNRLNINSNDTILDIGSGLGFALVIFNLFPFLKIDGLEISVKYREISQNNLNLLNINNIKKLLKELKIKILK